VTPRRILVVFAALVTTAPAAQAQTAPRASESRSTWAVASAPHVDLWFHALAVLGFEGTGPLPLYEPGYPARVAREKEARGIEPTALDLGRRRFRDAFTRDPAFEVLHFVPLWFAATDVDGMLQALRAVGRGAPEEATDPRARFGANATAMALDTPEERAALAAFADALEDEWRRYYADARDRERDARRARLGELQTAWDRDFGPALAPYLMAERLDRGVLLVSPPVGRDGRLFAGAPEVRSDNVVVANQPGGVRPVGSAPVELYAAVRELCFPVVRRAQSSAPASADPLTAERQVAFGAVRCGAALLERAAPGWTEGYRRSFLSGTPPADPIALRRAFEAAYPLDPSLAAALDRQLEAVPGR
jgi:hypothetical protein